LFKNKSQKLKTPQQILELEKSEENSKKKKKKRKNSKWLNNLDKMKKID
jgi:hypothetical protein